MRTFEQSDFHTLLAAIAKKGYQLIGPTVSDHAIIYDRISGVDDLPTGWIDKQDGGAYRLEKTQSGKLFDYTVGPHSPKKNLYPSVRKLWEARRHRQRFEIIPQEVPPSRMALIGLRSCELHAIAIQDKVLLAGPYVDDAYKTLRQSVLIIAVNCTRAGGTCFCASMETGPKAKIGFDIALTEIKDTHRHYFVAEAGTPAGSELLQVVPGHDTNETELHAADSAVDGAANSMGRTLDTRGLPELLNRRFDDPHWNVIAKRCLTCGNCTMVCPTCFCAGVEDSTGLTGETAERTRRWDSCFTVGFSYIHGGSIRATDTSRYRQWLMHKLGHWVVQFGTSGCVGCGRCITWCPVGIDITEEARTLRQTDKSAAVAS